MEDTPVESSSNPAITVDEPASAPADPGELPPPPPPTPIMDEPAWQFREDRLPFARAYADKVRVAEVPQTMMVTTDEGQTAEVTPEPGSDEVPAPIEKMEEPAPVEPEAAEMLKEEPPTEEEKVDNSDTRAAAVDPIAEEPAAEEPAAEEPAAEEPAAEEPAAEEPVPVSVIESVEKIEEEQVKTETKEESKEETKEEVKEEQKLEAEAAAKEAFVEAPEPEAQVVPLITRTATIITKSTTYSAAQKIRKREISRAYAPTWIYKVLLGRELAASIKPVLKEKARHNPVIS